MNIEKKQRVAVGYTGASALELLISHISGGDLTSCTSIEQNIVGGVGGADERERERE